MTSVTVRHLATRTPTGRGSAIVAIVAWRWLLNPQLGAVNEALLWLGVIEEPIWNTLPLVTLGITRDPGAFASVTFDGRLPWLLFALHAGALADRLDRRRTMTLVNL